MSGRLPFSGVVLLEVNDERSPLAVRVANSFMAKIAADLGATVVKLEPATGDAVRKVPPLLVSDGPGALYEFLNTGKTLVRLPEPRQAALEELVTGSVDALLAESGDPVLVLAAARGVSAVEIACWPQGVEGARPDLSEFAVLAVGGMLDMIGHPGRQPLRLGGHQAAYSAGLAGFTALSALLASKRAGQPADNARVSLVETMVWINWKAVVGAQARGVAPTRQGAEAEFQVLPCRDGHVAIVFTVTDFAPVAALIGDPALLAVKFATREGRRQNGVELYQLIGRWCASRTRAEIYAEAQTRNVPFGSVLSTDELLDDPQYKARAFIQPMSHPELRSLSMPRLPVLWNGRGFEPKAATTSDFNGAVELLQKTVGVAS